MESRSKNIQLSDDLINFFLEVTYSADDSDSDYRYISVEDKTNAYIVQHFLKYPLRIDASLVRNDLKELLNSKGHPTNDKILDALFFLYSIFPKYRRNVETIRIFISLICQVKLKQYILVDGNVSEEIANLSFHNFSIGEIDFDRISKFIENRASSDFVERYKKRNRKHFGIESKIRDIVCIDVFKWIDYCGEDCTKISDHTQTIVNIYLDAISAVELIEFETAFEMQQKFMTAYFGLHYNIKEFFRTGSTVINVFYGFFKRNYVGWVHPTILKIGRVCLPDNRILTEVNSFMKKNMESLFEADGEYMRYIKMVSDFFSNAEKNMSKERFNLAFMELFVGLDFLLSPDSEKSKKLKRRIAMLVHTYFGNSIVEQEHILDTLYDLRSDFIHNGKSIGKKDTEALRDISKVILAILFNLHLKNKKNVKLKYMEWLKKIDDHLHRNASNNINPTLKVLREMGIFNLENILTTSKAAKIFINIK